MSTSATDPEAVPDAWRRVGEASVADFAYDRLSVLRFGDRIDMWTTTGNHVVIPLTADAETMEALEQVVEQMQAFLQTARAR